MLIIIFIFLVVGLFVSIGFLMLLLTLPRAKKNAKLVRERADKAIENKTSSANEINVLIDQLTAIKNRRVVPFLEADQVRIDSLRKLRT
ncbi:MAG: hypothetical protein JWN89_630 [Parcubacteria group bacterium]|nr:hypothetical protein [Parcubacteria group bacterium]